MKKTKKKKQKINIEKAIFSVALLSIGIFVISLFALALIQGPSAALLGQSLQTSMVQGSGSVSSGNSTETAQSLIVVGATAFCILGFVIFLGLKIKDKFF